MTPTINLSPSACYSTVFIPAGQKLHPNAKETLRHPVLLFILQKPV